MMYRSACATVSNHTLAERYTTQFFFFTATQKKRKTNAGDLHCTTLSQYKNRFNNINFRDVTTQMFFQDGNGSSKVLKNDSVLRDVEKKPTKPSTVLMATP